MKNTHTADTSTTTQQTYLFSQNFIFFSVRDSKQNKLVKKLSTEEELKELLSRGKKYGINLNFKHLD